MRVWVWKAWYCVEIQKITDTDSILSRVKVKGTINNNQRSHFHRPRMGKRKGMMEWCVQTHNLLTEGKHLVVTWTSSVINQSNINLHGCFMESIKTHSEHLLDRRFRKRSVKQYGGDRWALKGTPSTLTWNWKCEKHFLLQASHGCFLNIQQQENSFCSELEFLKAKSS